jgi:hypothetical protein
MPETPTLAAICAAEDALREAWRRKDRATALELRADLARLWPRRRVELARYYAGLTDPWDDMPFSVRRA